MERTGCPTAPTSDELAHLTHTIAHRVARYLERQGLLERDVGISTQSKDLDFRRSFLETEAYQDLSMAPLVDTFGSITRAIKEGPPKDKT